MTLLLSPEACISRCDNNRLRRQQNPLRASVQHLGSRGWDLRALVLGSKSVMGRRMRNMTDAPLNSRVRRTCNLFWRAGIQSKYTRKEHAQPRHQNQGDTDPLLKLTRILVATPHTHLDPPSKTKPYGKRRQLFLK